MWIFITEVWKSWKCGLISSFRFSKSSKFWAWRNVWWANKSGGSKWTKNCKWWVI